MLKALIAYFKMVRESRITHIVILGMIMLFIFAVLLFFDLFIIAVLWAIITMVFVPSFGAFYIFYYSKELKENN